ncbi:Oligopeptide transport permease C-like, N-terminal domain protein [Acididesulfobacillus acetoxydans]|uniref:Oligopeptide transport permease C-like, N-terminal domain protein n=1 Tax=Acididesulfobacillus acetoxydans TaxID=1561005 RepID=A0A8S0W1L8_9FIRM|nr:ABC transporter permease [Acididesulfobacillus acetoxydans]CAA7599528.1 Oligopeptide transport permease C-like, N-terminal domain protein [Acididesulfobacillus acetoxydans]CEJ08697.1 Oligopeptide transport system permease protein AppC [Acididesulfobacillus acetoxydans]
MSGIPIGESPLSGNSLPGGNPGPEPAPRVMSLGGMAWRRFLRNPFAVAGLVVLLFFVIVALFARFIAPFDPARIDLLTSNLPFGSGAHILGTDELGRDIFSRLLYSSQVSLLVGFSVAFVSVFIGTLIGAVSGYFGGFVDTFFMRMVDVLNSVPLLFLNILMLAIFGSSFVLLICILALTSWMGVARLVRGTFLQLRETEYVEAAKALGTSDWRIITYHMIRNATAPIIVNATLMIGGAILSEAALSFLGLGIQPPQTSWGQMLSNAQAYMLTDPLQAVYPGLCILVVVLAVNFIGDGIQSAIDPRRKVRRPRRRWGH